MKKIIIRPGQKTLIIKALNARNIINGRDKEQLIISLLKKGKITKEDAEDFFPKGESMNLAKLMLEEMQRRGVLKEVFEYYILELKFLSEIKMEELLVNLSN